MEALLLGGFLLEIVQFNARENFFYKIFESTPSFSITSLLTPVLE